MSNYPSYRLYSALAEKGDKTIPPERKQEAGTGRFSQSDGFDQYNSLPIGEGGVPPKREDINGAFYLLSLFALWYQQGGVMKYAANIDYEPGNEVFSGSTKYRCLKGNGPSSAVVAPGADKTIWKNLDAPSVIAGQITPFYNCKLGGSDGRRLIPWGESVADERYVLCDGGTDGLGGNVPNLMDKFLLPSTVAQAGQTGGSLNLSIPGVTVNGTVGETVLTVDQIPSHTHTGSTSTAGYHTHTRGSMNITGFFGADDRAAWLTDGAFYAKNDASQNTSAEGGDGRPWWRILFDASRTWSGSTSESGSHSHSITMGSTGGGRGHTHTITSSSETQTLTLDRPPFYRLAYFVKLPE
ncbi:short-chain fatty acid transporter [uncultured Sutterella sp.]|uniref:short-chain fatty acid transporter n=1 Tax=uncultured Sutterella sp. TaxID=286133 RepID=UPI00280A52BF|nr:short-chain fatty acid transporter [uncultured Sutterella sp.]